MADALMRQWAMLRAVPRAPRNIDAPTLRSMLADEGFDVSLRGVQRDLESLSTRFPLLCDDRSKPFRWSWVAGFVFDVPGMDAPTALTFMLAQQFLIQVLPHSTLGLMQPHFTQAREVLEKRDLKTFAHWPAKVRVLPRGQKLVAPDMKPAVLDVVYSALLNEQCFSVRYRPRDADKITTYEVNPLGLVIRDAVIYLVCTLWDYTDIKQLALHRMIKVESLDKPVRRPEGFDLDAYIAEGAFSMRFGGETVQLEALFDADCAFHLHETWLSEDQTLQEQPDGRVLLKATAPNTGELRWWLLGFGEGVEVMTPPEMRDAFAHTAKVMAKLYR